MALKPTLYIALNNTHLEDFADHMNTNLREWCKIAWPRMADITTWVVNQQPDEVWTMGRNLNKTTILYIKAFQPTSTRYSWDISMPPIEGASGGSAFIDARRYQHDRVEVSLFGRDTAKLEELIMTWVEAHWKGQCEILDPNKAPQQRKEPWWLPIEPPRAGHEEYTRDDVFDWYHRGGKMFVRNVKDLADWLGVTKGTVHNLHSQYMSQYSSGMKPDSESHFVGMSPPPIAEE